MPQREHYRLISKIKGVDYWSDDLDRPTDHLKDAQNMELSYTNRMQGRRGYRQAWGVYPVDSVGAYVPSGLHTYKFNNPTEGTAGEELLLCNGNLFRMKESFFDIFNVNSQASLRYDDTDFPGAAVLYVDAQKYRLDLRSLGDLFDALNGDGFSVDEPNHTQFCNYCRLTASVILNSGTNTFTVDSTRSNLRVNDILVVADENLGMLRPVIVSGVSGTTITVEFPYRNTTGFQIQLSAAFQGVTRTIAQSIDRVEQGEGTAWTVYFNYLEAIPNPALFRGWTSGTSQTYTDMAVLTNPSSVAEWRFVDAADSCFIFPSKKPGGIA